MCFECFTQSVWYSYQTLLTVKLLSICFFVRKTDFDRIAFNGIFSDLLLMFGIVELICSTYNCTINASQFFS